MPDEIREVRVRQGDCVASIAAAHGIGDVRLIIDHPENRALFEAPGRVPGVLRPGDLVVVPMRINEHQLAPEDTLRVRVKVPRSTLRIRLTGAGDEALANKRVLARFATVREPRELSTDGDGFVEIPLPARAREVTLELPEIEETLVVALGHMDPISEASGVRKRLANLGYLPPDGGATEDELAGAVRRFREARSMPEGGVDDELRSALVDAHGS